MSYFGSDPMFTLMVLVGIVVFIGMSTMMLNMFYMSRKLSEISENTKAPASGISAVSTIGVNADKRPTLTSPSVMQVVSTSEPDEQPTDSMETIRMSRVKPN